MSVWIQVFQVLLIGFVWDSFVDSDSDIFWWSQAQWHDNEYEGDRFCYRYSFVSDQGGLRAWILSKDVVLAIQYSKYSKFT